MGDQDSPNASAPNWSAVLAGQTVQRVCPSAGQCDQVRCALRVLCRCAQADVARAARIENRFWLAMLVAGGLGLVIWLTAH